MVALSSGTINNTVSKWQPIATAPRDGEEILCIFGIGYDCPPPAVLVYENGHWFFAGLKQAGCIYNQPTHWQPLPAPPEQL